MPFVIVFTIKLTLFIINGQIVKGEVGNDFTLLEKKRKLI